MKTWVSCQLLAGSVLRQEDPTRPPKNMEYKAVHMIKTQNTNYVVK